MSGPRVEPIRPVLPWRDPALAGQLERLRHLGHRGGPILLHRALRTTPLRRAEAIASALIPLLLLAGYLAALPAIVASWAALLDFCRQVIALPGHVDLVAYRFAGLDFSVPFVHFEAGLPGNLVWWGGCLVTLSLLLLPLLLPRRWLPVVYALRVIALFQAGAQLFFAVWPHAFPYQGDGYVHGMLIAGLMFTALLPPLLGLTHGILDLHPGRKALLIVLAMGHALVMIPLQYLAHAYIIHHLSLLLMPVLFFTAGLPLNVLVFIAFYAWGASWPGPRDREAPAASAQEADHAV